MASDNQSTGTRNFAKAILFVFAIFGFLASIATIYEVFGKRQSYLVARAFPSTPKIPYYFYSQFGPGFEENGRTFINLLDERCAGAKDSKSPANANASDVDKANKHICRHTKELKEFSSRIEDAYVLKGTVFDVEIENKGDITATHIKIPAKDIEFIDVFSKGRRINISYDENSGDYRMPDLNPGEIYNLQIWQSGVPFSNGEGHLYNGVNITYDGPSIKFENYKYVRESDWEYVEMFFDLGPVMGTAMFLFAGFAATFAIIAAISLVIGLSQGKTVKEIFSTPDKAG